MRALPTEVERFGNEINGGARKQAASGRAVRRSGRLRRALGRVMSPVPQMPRTIALVLAAAALTGAQTREADRPVRAIAGGTLIDGTGRGLRPAGTILIKDGRIERLASGEAPELAAADRVIDATGKYILPGLIDAHIHYRDYYPELLVTHGITSVADWGGNPIPWILAQRDGVRKGELFGPRIYTSGDSYSDEPEDQTPEKAQAWLEKMLALGVDRIDIGFASPPEVLRVLIEGGHRANLPVSGYSAFVNEAIEMGIDAIKHTYPVGIACQTDPKVIVEIRAQAALPYRKRDIELPLVGPGCPDLASRLAERRVYWVPTLVKDFKVITDRREEFEIEAMRLLADPNLDYLPRADMFLMVSNGFGVGMATPGGTHFKGLARRRFDPIDYASPAFGKYHDAYRHLQRLIREVVQRGGRVLAGTAPHSYVLPGLSLHQELQLFVDAGLTPAQALQSAGLWAAQYMRQDRDLGSIEPGKLADILILDRNPLDDIRYARRVRMVIQGGRELPVGYHFSYRNPIPRTTRATAPGAASPRPVLQALSAGALARGSGPSTLTLSGDLFMDGAVVLIDGAAVETEYRSQRELRATVPERLLAEVGTHWVSVMNPPPGRIESSALPLIVTY